MTRRFLQLDVFTAAPYFGNPLAVVLDGEGLSDEEMQRFARWTNLSETTFLRPPKDARADYAVRIFTPLRELPFAGHPTIGSAYAYLHSGQVPKREGKLVQECGIGLVELRTMPQIAFAAPALIRSGQLGDAQLEQIARGLGIAREGIVRSAWCDNGPGWCAVMLQDAAAVLAIRQDRQALSQFKLGVCGAYPEGSPYQLEVRALIADASSGEDPVTGSLNAAIAQWLIGAGVMPEQYIASQGTTIGRAGRIYIRRDADAIWVGGDVVRCVEGTVAL